MKLPGMPRSKAQKPNEDFDRRQFWRISSALSWRSLLLLYIGPLACIMSSTLICNEKFEDETSQEWRMLSRSLSDCKSLTLNVMIQIWQFVINSQLCHSGKASMKKKRFLSGIARIMEGGGLPMPKFFGPLFRCAFLVNKKSLFLQKCQCIELLTVF